MHNQTINTTTISSINKFTVLFDQPFYDWLVRNINGLNHIPFSELNNLVQKSINVIDSLLILNFHLAEEEIMNMSCLANDRQLQSIFHRMWEMITDHADDFNNNQYPSLTKINKAFFKAIRLIDKKHLTLHINENTTYNSNKYSDLINSAYEAIISINPEGKIISWNSAAEKLYGYKYSEVVGHSLQDLLKIQNDDPLKARINTVNEEENQKEFECIRVRKDGHQVRLLNNIFPIKDAEGYVVGSGIISRDITAQKEAEEKLEETRLLIQQIAEASPNILYVFNIQTKKLVYVNNIVKDILGFTPEQFTLFSPEELKLLIHPDNYLNIKKWMQGFASENKVVESEIRFSNSKGEWRWLLKRETVFKKDSNGQPTLILGLCQDVTEQKLSQEKLRKSKALLLEAQELASLGNWEWNLETRELTFSDELYKILGFNPMQMNLGFDNVIESVGRQDIFNINKYAVKIISDGIPVAFEQKIKSSYGEEKHLYIKAKPVFNKEKKVIRIHGIALDITERKYAEETLQRTNEELKLTKQKLLNINNELEARVNERTEELRRKNEDLERINADLDNFVYTASHDLKAPISNIEGLIASLDLQTDPQNEDIKFIIGLMRVSILRFKETIKDLTEISKIQKNFNEDESLVEFEEFLEDIKFTLIELIVGSEATIDADFSKCKEISFSRKNFKSIIYNLVSNAIKYQHPDRKPYIKIYSEKIEGYAVLTVQDNGLGFNVKDKDKIFGMFKRLHDHVDGSGVGLYIVKKIIEITGGKIEVESQRGEGSTFRVYFKTND
ncbi:MAG: PAS domain S-box protein [Cytophagaceae bacterium]